MSTCVYVAHIKSGVRVPVSGHTMSGPLGKGGFGWRACKNHGKLTCRGFWCLTPAMIRMLSRASSVFCQSKSFCMSEHKSHMPGEGLSKGASTNMRRSENKTRNSGKCCMHPGIAHMKLCIDGRASVRARRVCACAPAPPLSLAICLSPQCVGPSPAGGSDIDISQTVSNTLSSSLSAAHL